MINKRVLSIATVLIFLVVCLCGCVYEEDYPTATKEFYVNDFADVISADAEQKILEKAIVLQDKTTAQVVVTTVNDLGGEEISQYAIGLSEKWGIGDAEQDNGVLILLSKNDREIFVSIGYGLEGALPDSKTGRIIDVYGQEHLKNNDFSTGLTAIAQAIINEVYIEYGLEPEEGYVEINKIGYVSDLEGNGGSVAISWAVLVIVFIIFLFINRRHGGGFPFFFIGPGFRGSGGFGSSGGSFGGFRGGGGSFGGGGAGRRF